jgi:hypothetical protein
MTSKKTVVKASVHSYENDRAKKYKNVFLLTSIMLVNYRIALLNSFVAIIAFFFSDTPQQSLLVFSSGTFLLWFHNLIAKVPFFNVS